MVLYNSLTKKREFLSPLDNKTIRIYVCGITPYDTTHVGHAFTYVFFDTLIRYLKYQGYAINYTQNVTDIDDDILKRAKKVNQNWKDLGNFWTQRYLSDMGMFHVLSPTHFVKATETIPEIINMVESLIEKGFAYEKEGSVYFNVLKYPHYGKLSKYPPHDMIKLLKERGGSPDDLNKINPLDFILWQKSKDDEPYWDSPWGKGRPGWHIECSAMSMKYLGSQIDIHGGGMDLIYPHHESEIAQSESYSAKKPFSKYWLHTAMVRYEGEKMSKSLGNLVLVSDLVKKYDPMAIRLLLLSHHFRTAWEFTYDELEKAQKELEIIKTALKKKSSGKIKIKDENYMQKFNKSMDNDMDTPAALKIILSLSNKIVENNNTEKSQDILRKITGVLGIEPD